MKIKYYILFICFAFIFITCKKEILVYDFAADENLELPLLLNFDGKSCFLDIGSKTFKYSADDDFIEDYSPYVEFQEYSEVIFNSIELENNSINDLGDIEINKPYSLTIISEGESTNFTFYFSSLPLVQIITLDKIKDQPKVFGRLIVNYTDLEEESENTLIGIEYRGASTGNEKKKSYGFELLNSFDTDDVKEQSFFDMRINNKWALDGMTVDSARMRNRTSFRIWKDLPGADHIGPEIEYVEVFHNYKSLGLFCFTEIYTEELLNLNEESVLIEGKGNTEETQFFDVSSTNQHKYWNRWEQKYPDPDERLNWGAFEDLCKLVVESDDPEFNSQIFSVLEENNIIDYFLFINVCYGYDNLGKNWFFMKKSPTEKFYIIPWDMDATWGRRHTGRTVEYDKVAGNGLFDRLIELNPSNFKQKLKSRWNELKEDEFSEEEILEHFDENFEILTEAGIIKTENNIWDAHIDLIDEQTFIHTWVKHRLIFLDTYFESM